MGCGTAPYCRGRSMWLRLVLLALASSAAATSNLREQAKTTTGFGGGGGVSGFESGYVRVNESTGSDMFYWYTPPLNGDPSAPVVLWLQGGPGASGLVGLLFEMGPYKLQTNAQGGWEVGSRAVTWAQEFGLLFVDSPIGTGFSRTVSEAGYARSQDDVARDLWTMLQWFFGQQYPELANNDFYVMGESYGGHYGPHLAAYIHKQNQRIIAATQQQQQATGGEVVVRLAGLAVGDGLTDPAVQVLTKPAAAYAFGLLDGKQLLSAQRLALQASVLARQGRYKEARDARVQLEDLISSAGGVDLMDVRLFLTDAPDLDGPIGQWANTPEALADLHLPPDAHWGTDKQVMSHLEGDVMVSYADCVALLLDEARVPVLLYQGQFDLKDGVMANQAWIQTDLRWSGRGGWLAANRTSWCLEDDPSRPAGWVQHYGLLSQVVVQGAGHLLPMDQPERALDMVTRFIKNQPFTPALPQQQVLAEASRQQQAGELAQGRLRGTAVVAVQA